MGPTMTTEISTENWKAVQVKTFTKWINNKLSSTGHGSIKDIFEDCRDGIALINLLEGITGTEIKHNRVANTRYKSLENNQFLIEFLKNSNLQIVNIRSSDLTSGNQKLLLGLIWIIILRFGITLEGDENTNSKKALLAWCRAVTEPYKNVDVKDFSTSWKDGLAFNAIIHRFRPDLVGAYDDLRSKNAAHNVSMAFDIAEKHFGIAKLLDPEDIVDEIRPDEKSVFTYVSQYYNKFRMMERAASTKRRATELLKKLNWSIKSRHEYEKTASHFLDMAESFQRDEDELRTVLGVFLTKLARRREMALILNTMFLELKSLYGNIVVTNAAYKIKSYDPPAHLTIESLDTGIYETGLVKFDEDGMLLARIESYLKGNFPDRAKAAQRIKRAFDSRRSIDDQLAELRSESLARDVELVKELVDPVVTIGNKVAYLEDIKNTFESRDKLYEQAISLFKERDKDSTGKIDLNSLIQCLKAVGCTMSPALERKIMEDSPNFFTLDEYLESIDYLRSESTTSVQFEKDMEDLRGNGDVTSITLSMRPEDVDFITDAKGAIDVERVASELVI